LGQREVGKGGDGKREEEMRRSWNVGFWNVAGLRNKDEKYWEFLKEWEVIILTETWVKEKEKGRIKGKLPKVYVWGCGRVKKIGLKED